MKYAIRFFAVVFLGIASALIGPYIVSDEMMKRLVAKAVSAPVGELFYPDTGRNAIAAVTIDDDDVYEAKLSWPVSYGTHADVLARLAQFSPRLIFVDILFIDRRNDRTITDLSSTLCELSEQGVAVLLAARSGIDGQVMINPDLDGLVTASGKPCYTPVAITRTDDAMDQRSWSYLQHETNNWLQTDAGKPLPSAAFAAFRTAYPKQADTLLEDDMALVWGTRAAPYNVDWMKARDPVSDQIVGTCRQWTYWDAVPPFLRKGSFFSPDKADRRDVCPYHSTIPIRRLIFAGSEQSDKELDELVRGRLIVYGTNLIGLPDRVNSPVHGSLPGVHLHAMALDNLISFAGDFKKALDFDITKPSSPGTLMPIVCIVLLALFDVVLHRLRRARATWLATHLPPPADYGTSKVRTYVIEARHWLRVSLLNRWQLAIALGFAALCSLMFSIAWYGFGIGPLGWVEYVALPLLLESLDKVDRFEDWLAKVCGIESTLSNS